MSEVDEVPPPRLKVFISYSRADLANVERLRDALLAVGFQAYLDLHDILPGEPWQERLGKLIETADSVVFALSPSSVASEIVNWEVNEGERLSKRILPVVIHDTAAEQVPGRIKRLNYIFMRNGSEWSGGLEKLKSALLTDIEWIREHTRIGEIAGDWQRRGQTDEPLLRGSLLASAERWVSECPREAPEPTELQRKFLKVSREAEHRRLVEERARLEEVAKALDGEKIALRRGQRALATASVLFACIVVGAIAVYKRDFLMRQWFWLAYIRGHTLTTEQVQALKPMQSFRECAQAPGEDADAPRFSVYSIYCPEMVVVPAGKSVVGSPSDRGDRKEHPQHTVTIARPFAVSRFEVTAEQWQACVSYGGCPPGGGTGKEPASSIRWHDAQHYVSWLSKLTGQNYRLLSNAEWEYAARAGSTTDYSWGNELGKGNANCSACGSHWDGKSAAPVGSFKPNDFGLYDMHGNVWEWVKDPWHDDYTGAPTDGSAWLEGANPRSRVIRGGAWYGDPLGVRVARRGRYTADDRGDDVGFRIARTLGL